MTLGGALLPATGANFELCNYGCAIIAAVSAGDSPPTAWAAQPATRGCGAVAQVGTHSLLAGTCCLPLVFGASRVADGQTALGPACKMLQVAPEAGAFLAQHRGCRLLQQLALLGLLCWLRLGPCHTPLPQGICPGVCTLGSPDTRCACMLPLQLGGSGPPAVPCWHAVRAVDNAAVCVTWGHAGTCWQMRSCADQTAQCWPCPICLQDLFLAVWCLTQPLVASLAGQHADPVGHVRQQVEQGPGLCSIADAGLLAALDTFWQLLPDPGGDPELTSACLKPYPQGLPSQQDSTSSWRCAAHRRWAPAPSPTRGAPTWRAPAKRLPRGAGAAAAGQCSIAARPAAGPAGTSTGPPAG